jgi:hypothetical protein
MTFGTPVIEGLAGRLGGVGRGLGGCGLGGDGFGV